jgi:hypothetical protein
LEHTLRNERVTEEDSGKTHLDAAIFDVIHVAPALIRAHNAAHKNWDHHEGKRKLAEVTVSRHAAYIKEAQEIERHEPKVVDEPFKFGRPRELQRELELSENLD